MYVFVRSFVLVLVVFFGWLVVKFHEASLKFQPIQPNEIVL